MPPDSETAEVVTACGGDPPPPPGRPPGPGEPEARGADALSLLGGPGPLPLCTNAGARSGPGFDARYLIGCPDSPLDVTVAGLGGAFPEWGHFDPNARDATEPVAIQLTPPPSRPAETLPAVGPRTRIALPTSEGDVRPRGASEGEPMRQSIVARGVQKWYGTGRDRTQIVRSVNLSIGPGETVFLVGPSGSGKTTLLSILGCILTPDQGVVEVLGRDITGMRREEVAEFRLHNLGYIFQTFNLFPTLSALDNVRIALAIRGVRRPAARARAAELLERVGLSHRLHARPSRLSTGESQRVAIARALAGSPGVLLADEPTASLDAENGQAVMKMLSGLARDDGLTLLIVTHDNRIVSFADRILRLEDGRLAGPDGGVVVPHFHAGGRPKEVLA